MNDEELNALLEKAVSVRGREAVRDSLTSLLEQADNTDATLTIIANAGVHQIPNEYLRGEVYPASHGNWNVSSKEDIDKEFRRILGDLGRKLRERPWKRIYLIPTGHPALAIQIKLFVYRVMRINTIDLFYSNGQYHEVLIDHREIVLKKDADA